MKNLPTNESSFYQLLKEETLASIFWERLELKTDSGYPDTGFVLRKPAESTLPSEGTVELKFQRDDKKWPNLHALMKGTQKANFLEYSDAGGRRRWLLCCNKHGTVFLYTVERVCQILRGGEQHPSTSADFFDEIFPVRSWLPYFLEMEIAE
jgi:hypothetical protein